MEVTELHGAVESLLFASGDPVSLERLSQVLEQDTDTVQQAVEALMDDYRFSQRGLRIVKLQNSYQMTSAPEYAVQIRAMMEKRRGEKLSSAALEVLSIIAYFQPVTRAYVEQVRGVDSTYTLGLLQDRELVEECGRLDVPGRPILYRTGQNFLRSFGLESLEELPELPTAESEQEEDLLPGKEEE